MRAVHRPRRAGGIGDDPEALPVGLDDEPVHHAAGAGAGLGEMDRRVEVGGRPARPVPLEGRAHRGDGPADQDPHRDQDDDDLDQRDPVLRPRISAPPPRPTSNPGAMTPAIRGPIRFPSVRAGLGSAGCPGGSPVARYGRRPPWTGWIETDAPRRAARRRARTQGPSLPPQPPETGPEPRAGPPRARRRPHSRRPDQAHPRARGGASSCRPGAGPSGGRSVRGRLAEPPGGRGVRPGPARAEPG